MTTIAARLKRKASVPTQQVEEKKPNIDRKCETHTGNAKLFSEFYNVACIDLAKALLGKLLVRRLDDGTKLSGKIVETECYLGGEDKASHSYNGHKTDRNTPMFMDPGTAYVYYIYGMYNCFNISSQGDGAAVLIRSLQPMDGTDQMQKFRQVRRKLTKQLKVHELCNGPSKLCQSLQINKEEINREHLALSSKIWIEDVNSDDDENWTVVQCKRIGIESAGPLWADKKLRFYYKGCKYVSVKDKAVEKTIDDSG